MAMPLIVELIYAGKTAEELGLDAKQYTSRYETLNRYLGYSGGKFTPEGYLSWLKEDAAGSSKHNNSTDKLPKIGTMSKNLVSSGIAWVKAGCKFVGEEEQQQRWAICKSCEHLIDKKRCSKCGCFMEIKSKLAGMKCPINLW